MGRGDVQALAIEWLRPQLPAYAMGFADPILGIAWDKLLDPKTTLMLSTGEKAAIALMGHLDDRAGVAPAVGMRGMTLAYLLGCIPRSYRDEFCHVLRAYVQGVWL